MKTSYRGWFFHWYPPISVPKIECSYLLNRADKNVRCTMLFTTHWCTNVLMRLPSCIFCRCQCTFGHCSALKQICWIILHVSSLFSLYLQLDFTVSMNIWPLGSLGKIVHQRQIWPFSNYPLCIEIDYFEDLYFKMLTFVTRKRD